MNLPIPVLFVFLPVLLTAQVPSGLPIMPVKIESYQTDTSLMRIGPGPNDLFQRTDIGYTLLLPPGDTPPKGISLSLGGRRWPIPDTIPADGSLDHEALLRGVAVLRVTSGNPLNFYFDDSEIAGMAGRIQDILIKNHLEEAPVYITGMSLAGTRALKLAIFLEQKRADYWLQLRGIAIVDAPLDMVRFWEAEQRAIRNDFHPSAAGEGKWVSYLLKENLGGSPEENYNRYVEYSPFVYGAPDGGNARYLTGYHLRVYHEPDINWWIEHRRKDYYSMNSVDLAGLVNELKLQGSERAHLITTHQARDGYAKDSSPHSWSIVDNAELMEWFTGLVD